MSLLWRGAARHPIYEVGDTSDWDEQPDPREMQVSRYGEGDKVDPGTMGMPVVDTSKLRYNTAGGYDDNAMIPTHTLRASQSYLYAPHVRNLASVPADVFNEPGGTHEADPISVVRTKEGHHVVMDGHHRAAASILRGDSHVKARLEGVEV